MLMKHLKDIDGVTHCEGNGGNDYTLCGLAMEGENGDTPMFETPETIGCHDCIAVIEHCKRVRSSEIKFPYERRVPRSHKG